MIVGKIYKVKHSRKGVFTIQVTSINETWVTGTIINGTADALLNENIRYEGEEITVRISFLTIIN